ncbi:MAG TPA: fibrobacter succinogenes major paralogous domain-containing protein [Bacteroidales bacterium]|nr:fibrobacter succinogenes major paralogous domain-containing protein [Bacteroidales bacterium]
MKKPEIMFASIIICLVMFISACNSDNKKTETSTEPETEEIQYESIEIGEQEWMLYNISTDTFNNGDIILEAKTEAEWIKAKNNQTAVWCYYENKSKNGDKYGKLYNWYAVTDDRGIAPKDWHIPTEKDIKKLLDYLGNDNEAFNTLIEDGDSGFEALYSGWRRGTGVFADIDNFCAFWTSTENGEYGAWSLDIDKGNRNAVIGYSRKEFGISVRCIKD